VETWRSTPPMTITRSWEEFLAARTGEAAGERPFFLFVNILDPHLPYRPPPAFARATLPAGTSDEQRHRATMVAMPQAVGHMAGTAPLDDEALATLRGLYAAEVSYADTRIGGLLDLLRETGELDRTLVVWTSDHGENIGDHGLMDHQFCLYETLLHVPLILRLPGRFEGGGLEDAPAQLVDVMPTILDAVGIERERWPTMDGTPLGPEGLPPDRPVIAQTRRPLSQRAIFAEHAPGFEFARFDHRLTSIQVGQHKLILTDDGEAELYDLQADPAEARDRADEDPARVEELRTLLQKQGLASAPGPVQATPELDQATVEALRALGYLP